MRFYALSLAIFFGLLCTGYIIKKALLEVNLLNRTVAVKGLAEKEVMADKSIWNISIRAVGDDLVVLQNKIEEDAKKVEKFLTDYKIDSHEISKGDFHIFDKLVRGYTNENKYLPRYTLEFSLVVNSKKVDQVYLASQNVSSLLVDGVQLSTKEYDYNGPRFIYSKLNEIKPIMLAEAAKNARLASEEFAKNSQSKIGKIKAANQGSFSIEAPESLVGDETRYIKKKVRVVSSVNFYIND